ncbi:cilia- and flagella-associated protein 251-like [Procambarus clarkii]|uniref:cilia- and flagella-associated protein 251-like n=1 Tax=Procambarus clarkii TaxID=6728 RepID=UPI003742C743
MDAVELEWRETSSSSSSSSAASKIYEQQQVRCKSNRRHEVRAASGKTQQQKQQQQRTDEKELEWEDEMKEERVERGRGKEEKRGGMEDVGGEEENLENSEDAACVEFTLAKPLETLRGINNKERRRRNCQLGAPAPEVTSKLVKEGTGTPNPETAVDGAGEEPPQQGQERPQPPEAELGLHEPQEVDGPIPHLRIPDRHSPLSPDAGFITGIQHCI